MNRDIVYLKKNCFLLVVIFLTLFFQPIMNDYWSHFIKIIIPFWKTFSHTPRNSAGLISRTALYRKKPRSTKTSCAKRVKWEQSAPHESKHCSKYLDACFSLENTFREQIFLQNSSNVITNDPEHMQVLVFHRNSSETFQLTCSPFPNHFRQSRKSGVRL